MNRLLMMLCERVYRMDPDDVVPWPIPTGWGDQLAGVSFDVIEREGPDNKRRDRAIVSSRREGVVVVFRGTQPPDRRKSASQHLSTFLDWANNLDVIGATSVYPGRVHAGFAEATNALFDTDAQGRDGVEAAVKRRLAAGRTRRRIFITGHSKGGPLAALTAWRLSQDPALEGVGIRVVTFASARAGDDTFVKAFAEAGISYLGHEATGDVVPFVPPGANLALKILPFLAALLRTKPVAAGKVGFQTILPVVRDHDDALSGGLGWRMMLAAMLTPGLSPLARVVDAHLIYENSQYDRLVED
jgi:hypothetical protein